MLESITKRMTDVSDGDVYRFIFYCDLCGKPWHSVPYRTAADSRDMNACAKDIEHNAAYERANKEAISRFNHCGSCGRMVCDDCFQISNKGDFCKECGGKHI